MGTKKFSLFQILTATIGLVGLTLIDASESGPLTDPNG
jgi:hypothetical protein